MTNGVQRFQAQNRALPSFITGQSVDLKSLLKSPGTKKPSSDTFSLLPSSQTSVTSTTARRITTPVFSWVNPNELSENQKKYLNKGKFVKDQNGQMYYVGLIRDNARTDSSKTVYKFTHIKINNKKNEEGDPVYGSVDYTISDKMKKALTREFDSEYKGMRRMAIHTPRTNGNKVTAHQFIEYENGDLKEIREHNWAGKPMHQKSIYLNQALNSVIKYERDQFGRLNSINDTEYGVHVAGKIHHHKTSNVKVETGLDGRSYYYRTVSEDIYLNDGDSHPSIRTSFNNYGEPTVTTRLRENGSIHSKKYHKRISETHFYDSKGKLIGKDHSNGLKLFASRGQEIDIIRANRGSSGRAGASIPDSVLALINVIDSKEKYNTVIDYLERNGQSPHPGLLEHGEKLS